MGLQNPKRGLLTRNYGLRKKWLLSLVGHPPFPQPPPCCWFLVLAKPMQKPRGRGCG